MSTRTKNNIVTAIERLGLATVAVIVLWTATRSDSAEARENDREMRNELVAITRDITQVTTTYAELKRLRLIQDAELESALNNLARVSEHQTEAIEALIVKLESK